MAKTVYRLKRLPIIFSRELEQFPNFHCSGSIKGMKKNVYGNDALLVKCGQYIYNVDKHYYDMAN